MMNKNKTNEVMKINKVYDREGLDRISIGSHLKIFYKHSPRTAWLIDVCLELRTDTGFLSLIKQEESEEIISYQTLKECVKYFDENEKDLSLNGVIRVDFRNCAIQTYLSGSPEQIRCKGMLANVNLWGNKGEYQNGR